MYANNSTKNYCIPCKSFKSGVKMICMLLTILNLACFLEAKPLAKRMVDMTYVFDETTQNFPIHKKFQIDYLQNGTIEEMGGLWIQMEEFSSSTHAGTHMDAPSHFVKGGLTVDEIPLSQFIGPAAVIDITSKAKLNPDAEATIEDLLKWESGTGQTLNGTIIMLRSGWGHKWHDRAAFLGTSDGDKRNVHYPGISPDACQCLVDNREVKGIGTETLSLDIGTSRDFFAHRIVLGRGLFILENVSNMDQLPIYGAMLHALPMKIGNGSGAPTRVIATIPEVIYNLPSCE